MKQLIVTGASGYIGKRLCEVAEKNGWMVVALGRNTALHDQRMFFNWSLGAGLPPQLAVRPDSAIIHLAHVWSSGAVPNRGEADPNIVGTRNLLKSSREAGVGRFVFVSSLSAREDALNSYGRVKWQIESALNGNCVSARVGLVYGGPRVAMYGQLMKLVKLFPILPMITPRRKVQPIHLDEVCEGLLELAQGTQVGWVGLANSEPITFGEVLRALAREMYGFRIAILPIPLCVALFASRLLSVIPFLPSVSKERILGFAGAKVVPCKRDLLILGISVQPLAERLRAEPTANRALINEAYALLSYVADTGQRVDRTLIRRYVRCVRATEGAKPIGLWSVAVRFPALLRVLEPPNGETALGLRLRVASTIASTSPSSFESLGRWKFVRIAYLTLSVLLDITMFPLRLLLARFRNE